MANTYNLTPPDGGLSVETTLRVKTSKFGDGYVQTAVDGINPFDDTWNLSWSNRTKEEIAAITSFFRAQLGSYFLWVTPDGETVKVAVTKWSANTQNPKDCSLTATWERRYAL